MIVVRPVRCVAVLIAAVSMVLVTAAQATNDLPVSYICIEAESGLVLMEAHADIVRPPASMLKMM